MTAYLLMKSAILFREIPSSDATGKGTKSLLRPWIYVLRLKKKIEIGIMSLENLHTGNVETRNLKGS